MARAISSLPVPVSPKIRTVESVGATSRTSSSTVFNTALSPTIPSNAVEYDGFPPPWKMTLLSSIVLGICAESMSRLLSSLLRVLISTRLLKCGVNFPQQRVASYWLVQETGGSGFHHQVAKGPIPVGGDKNDWDFAVCIDQPSLQFDAAHPWQAHVKDQTRCVAPLGGLKKLFSRGESIYHKTGGLQYAPQRLTKGFIIVNNCDKAGLG